MITAKKYVSLQNNLIIHIIFILFILCLFILDLEIKSSKPEDNVWEMSGLFEGDIVESPEKNIGKNGLTGNEFRWPEGIVPVFIHEDDFGKKKKNKNIVDSM